MAWCPYCRRNTVNGRCPSCNRVYEDVNKLYGYSSGNNSKEKKSYGSSYSIPYEAKGGSFIGGFFLAIAINFIAIIISAKIGKKRMLGGAIVGTIFGSILLLSIVNTIITSLSAYDPEWYTHILETLKELIESSQS